MDSISFNLNRIGISIELRPVESLVHSHEIKTIIRNEQKNKKDICFIFIVIFALLMEFTVNGCVAFYIDYNVRVYDQLRLQSASVSSYTYLGRSVTDVSVLYYDSDSQTTNQAIGYTRCCKQCTLFR